MKLLNRFGKVALLVGALPLTACSDFLKVTNPGPIEDGNLNDPDAFPGLVVGMSSDYSIIFDDVIMLNMIASDEMAHGGSYTQPGLYYRGVINDEDIGYEWGGMQRARWVAEDGIQRMREAMGDKAVSDPLVGRAHLWAGLSNRLLGENVCDAVFDGGKKEPFSAYFSRAEGHFTEALRIAETKGDAKLRDAALGGRAAVRAWQGNWDGAVADASRVPTSFVFSASYSTNSSRENNDLVSETHGRFEYTVYDTRWAQVSDDPRVPWRILYTKDGAVQKGQDGKTDYYQQMKFTDRGDDIPLVKGTEMLLLRAEAALRKNDVAGAMALINQERAFLKMDPLPTPAGITEAWKVLQEERGAVLWLEGRRFWDLRRWHGETGPARNTFLEGRDKCIPISREEKDSNPNLG